VHGLIATAVNNFRSVSYVCITQLREALADINLAADTAFTIMNSATFAGSLTGQKSLSAGTSAKTFYMIFHVFLLTQVNL
jgi:hypothetical protein